MFFRLTRNAPKRPAPPPPSLSEALQEPSILHGSLHLRRDGIYCRGRVRDNDTGKILFDECVATKPLMDSLLGSTDEAIMTCTCGEPGCAGFWQQESSLSESRVHWFLLYKKESFDIIFDRNEYEISALEMLKQFKENPWENAEFPFGAVPSEYPDFATFAQTLDNLLAHSPRLSGKWATL